MRKKFGNVKLIVCLQTTGGGSLNDAALDCTGGQTRGEAFDAQCSARVGEGKPGQYTDHCATCFADGIQVITGCTFGKGNIRKTNIGKWDLTLINKKTQQSVRVVPKGEAMLKNKQSVFMKEYRSQGIPATKVPDAVVQPMVENVMSMQDEALLNIGEVVAHPYQQKAHSFDGFICADCGEMVVEQYGRIRGDGKVCISCHGWDVA